MSAIINLVMMVLTKFGFTETPASSGKKPSYIYMKRVTFVAAVFFVAWAVIDPESLGIRLEHASEVLPSWFTGLLASVFTGIFI